MTQDEGNADRVEAREPQADVRGLLRRRVFKGATIEIQNRSAVDCTVRNLSADGAKLQLSDSYWIPEHFMLNVPSEGLRRRCEVRWRREGEIGVAFVEG